MAQLTEANATLAMEKDALQARLKTLPASPDASTATLREENEILKKQLASIKSQETVAPQGGDLNQKLQETQSHTCRVAIPAGDLALGKSCAGKSDSRNRNAHRPSRAVSTDLVPARKNPA